MIEFNSPMFHPEYEALVGQVRALQTDVVTMLTERDHLILQDKPRIEATYLLKIGVYEHKVFEFQCDLLRIRRKIEMVRAKTNRLEPVDITKFERALDEEYAEFTEKIMEQKAKLDRAMKLESGSKTLDQAEAEELRKFYFDIVRKLHPDVHPNPTTKETETLQAAMKAYENGDLERMRVIHTALLVIAPTPETESAFEELIRLRDDLTAKQTKITAVIEKIKTSFPFDQIEILNDVAAVEQRKIELSELLKQAQNSYAEYEKELKSLLA